MERSVEQLFIEEFEELNEIPTHAEKLSFSQTVGGPSLLPGLVQLELQDKHAEQHCPPQQARNCDPLAPELQEHACHPEALQVARVHDQPESAKCSPRKTNLECFCEIYELTLRKALTQANTSFILTQQIQTRDKYKDLYLKERSKVRPLAHQQALQKGFSDKKKQTGSSKRWSQQQGASIFEALTTIAENGGEIYPRARKSPRDPVDKFVIPTETHNSTAADSNLTMSYHRKGSQLISEDSYQERSSIGAARRLTDFSPKFSPEMSSHFEQNLISPRYALGSNSARWKFAKRASEGSGQSYLVYDQRGAIPIFVDSPKGPLKPRNSLLPDKSTSKHSSLFPRNPNLNQSKYLPRRTVSPSCRSQAGRRTPLATHEGKSLAYSGMTVLSPPTPYEDRPRRLKYAYIQKNRVNATSLRADKTPILE